MRARSAVGSSLERKRQVPEMFAAEASTLAEPRPANSTRRDARDRREGAMSLAGKTREAQRWRMPGPDPRELRNLALKSQDIFCPANALRYCYIKLTGRAFGGRRLENRRRFRRGTVWENRRNVNKMMQSSRQMAQAQEELAKEITASAGGGAVKATMTGSMELVSVEIDLTSSTRRRRRVVGFR